MSQRQLLSYERNRAALLLDDCLAVDIVLHVHWKIRRRTICDRTRALAQQLPALPCDAALLLDDYLVVALAVDIRMAIV